MNSGGLCAVQIAEADDELAHQNNITERLNNVDDEVVRFYKLNCLTFNKKITGELRGRTKVTCEEFSVTIKTNDLLGWVGAK